MTTFDDRERAFENLFAHDQDLAFRAQARRNREIGLWAAHQLGRSGAEADAYAAEILMTSIEKGGTDALVARLRQDLEQHGLAVSDHQIRRRLDELLAEAVDYVKRR
jgi:hypothetical protein